MAWWKTAKPGEPVVCVRTCTHWHGEKVFEGRVYVLREILPPSLLNLKFGVRLKGVSPLDQSGTCEGCWFASDFRPAKVTDLPASITECLNTPVKTEERV